MLVNASPAESGSGRAAPHVALMVQNVSLADDNRLQKQVHDLVAS